ncbi:MAG: hypothetical protein J6Y25_04560 [Elusimicrobiaceae bacterium]|nr:hypothetical protein [Elusimicrobiaceae bacterium]
MQIESADMTLLDIRTQLRALLPGVINTINQERNDFELKQIADKHYFLNVEEAINATQFVVISGALQKAKNAGPRQVTSLLVNVFVGFTPHLYGANKDFAVCASYRYQAALMAAFAKMELPFGNLQFVGAEPPGSLRIGNKALYGALVQYDIQLF